MGRKPAPQIHVEPPIPVTTEFATVEHVRSVIQQLDNGNFRQPALLIERMLWNPRFRAVLETRLAGLIATEIRFEPSQNNRDGRRAAAEFAEDWPFIAPAPMRKQMMKWALLLGLGIAQRPCSTSTTTGRHIFKLRPYWPGFAFWYWANRCYRIQTYDSGVTSAATPSLEGKIVERFATSPISQPPPPASESPWVIAEPFGVNSFRDALVHAAWRPWLGHDWGMRDQARASEKHGIGVYKAMYPRGSGDEHEAAIADFTRGLRQMGSEGVIPLEQRADGTANFNVEALEFNGAGFNAISDTMGSNAVALAILFLGHNLTTEIKGGGSYAAAGVADYIRDDKKVDDSDSEWTYARPQLAEPWAEANYGDPGLAPIARYVTDSPAVNLQRAQMINQMAMAAAQLRANVPRVDLDQLAEQFRLPMLAAGVQVQVPPAPAPPPGATAPAQPAEERAA